MSVRRRRSATAAVRRRRTQSRPQVLVELCCPQQQISHAHIHDVIADLRLDVLALTETWITSDAPDAVKLDVHVAPPGYSVVHRARGTSTDKGGGGIALIHRGSIRARVVELGTWREFEVLTVRLTLQSAPVIISGIYRPPGAVSRAFCDAMDDLLDQLFLTGQRFAGRVWSTSVTHLP